jgi:YbbR-like protein
MRLLRRIFFEDLGWKLLALAISFFLWASYTAEPFAQVDYNVPLAFVNVPPGLAIADQVPSSAHVLIRGRAGLVQRLAQGDLSLMVDLQKTHAGQAPVRLTTAMVNAPYGIEVIRITPSQFRVSLVPSRIALPPPE